MVGKKSKFFVEYKVGAGPFVPVDKRTSHRAGPYPTRDEAETHQRDIAGYEGVSSCYVSEES